MQCRPDDLGDRSVSGQAELAACGTEQIAFESH